MNFRRYFLVGGAGFIGSHFTDYLLNQPDTERLTVFDNLSSGREWHFEPHLKDERFNFVRGDIKDGALLTESMLEHDVVFHFASNPDISKAMTDPSIDFWEGTYLTNQVVEAMRSSTPKHIIYTSGSGVYGDLGEENATENRGPNIPVSTYGASKLAGETLISSYCHMFGLTGLVLRFGNVVGPRQTHGVGFDFVRKLLSHPSKLTVLGDGSQSKSYIHVTDVIQAVQIANEKRCRLFDAFNVATGDYITVKEIAALAIESVNLDPNKVFVQFGKENRGWKGDVPVVRLDIGKISSLGWKPKYNSREALKASMLSMIADARDGRI
ncbi:MAG: NAD-dependent epimerase/dehydratase family protein [Chlamydiae bacterium]|nr:NAD-dependent epimerase/dehydratase family protein [Chlamydiota bacterium]